MVRQWFLSAGVDRQHAPSRQLSTLLQFAEQLELDSADDLVTAIGELSGVLAASNTDPIIWRRNVLNLLVGYVLGTSRTAAFVTVG